MPKKSTKADEAYADALWHIKDCRKWKVRRLDLSEFGVTTLPPEIGQLTVLQELNLSKNQLTTLPPEIGQLVSLRELYLGQNHLTTLPPEIGKLKALMRLYLSGNHLTTLPPEVGQLTALTDLYLNINQLTTLPPEICQLTALTKLSLDQNHLTTLPPEIGKLTRLRWLQLSINQLTTLPPEIGRLTALTDLYLSGNLLATLPTEIGQIPDLTWLYLQSNRLTRLPVSLQNLRKLDSLFLHDNPALQISPSILGPDPRTTNEIFASAKSILDFYFGTKTGKTRPLNEVKLILIGRGSAGKTSMVRALRDLPFQDDEESTPGIALCDWPLDACKGEPVTAHVWDFAGQVITHALHQFFFSVRSVYVVVLTGRENSEREDAEYWLRLIKAFGTDEHGHGPPVIIALNKWDVPGCRPRVDRGALVERYPFIRGFVETDCKTELGIAQLKAALCAEVDQLAWVREPFPETWDNVRVALAKDGNARAHLTYAEYRKLCKEHGVTDEGQQDSLSEILHNLGAALNYRTDPRLREATVLKPEWLTSNVYKLLRQAEKRDGVLKLVDVDQVLSDEKYEAMRAYLMQIMERFEIAYSRPTFDGVWLVPQALPDDQPPGAAAFRDATDATRLRYVYPALPEGLVARAIVRLHEFIEEVDGKKQQWGSGAILTREGARALLRSERQERQVMITVTGPTKARQQLAGLCQAEMRDIHDEIKGLNPIEETQVVGSWVATKTLEADEKNSRHTGIPTESGTLNVDPAEPNNAYSEKPARFDEVWKPTVFICYSRSNVSQRKRLESELKILMNEGLLAAQWHDRMIDPGDKWDDAIQNELAKTDVVIVLVSVAALSTDYITNREIPKALERRDAGETKVIPVILEKCRWEGTALEPINALPEKAKPLTDWNPRSDGWYTIANGLAKVFRKLMANGGKRGR
ncbi:MAG TPA: COR domain-containing protein [Gemmataceae bacterium]|nr:COR domain-containing protein [Gemmataceae bacterium]